METTLLAIGLFVGVIMIGYMVQMYKFAKRTAEATEACEYLLGEKKKSN